MSSHVIWCHWSLQASFGRYRCHSCLVADAGVHRVSAAKSQILPLWVHDTNLYLVYSTYFIVTHCITNLACRFVPTLINIDQHCTQPWRQFCILPVTFLFTQAGSVLRRAALFLAPRPFGGGLNDTLLARLRQVRSRCRNRLRLRVICFISWSVDLLWFF